MTTRLTSTLLAGFLALAGPQIATAQTAAPTPQAFTPTIAVGGELQPELDAGAQGDSRFPASDRIFLRRARLGVSGKILPDIAYKLQGDLAGGLGSSTSIKAQMTDGYIEWTRYAAAHIRAGQFKAGFGEEWLTSNTSLITIERTLATDRLTLNRQIGAQVAGKVAGTRLSYSAGLFNGNGRNVTINDNGKFLYTLHGSALAWQGTRSGSLRVSAAGYWATDRQLSESADFGLDSTPGTPAADNLLTGRSRGLSLDAQWLAGPWRLDAELLRDTFEQDNGVPQAEVIGRGWYVMPAAFVHARSVQVVGRYECFTPDASRDDDRTREWLAGVNYYIRGLNKVMIDYLWVDAPSSPDEHQKVLAQWQVVF